jgi:hypothetical protein
MGGKQTLRDIRASQLAAAKLMGWRTVDWISEVLGMPMKCLSSRDSHHNITLFSWLGEEHSERRWKKAR